MLIQANEAYVELKTRSIPMETNEAYVSTQCVSTQDCSTTPSIPTEANEAYGTNPRILTHPGDSPDKNMNYSNMDYDYIIPWVIGKTLNANDCCAIPVHVLIEY